MPKERKTCSRCGDQPVYLFDWTMNPCAVDNTIHGKLCRQCDVDFNACVLSFFRVRNRKKLMEIYDDKSLRTEQAATAP